MASYLDKTGLTLLWNKIKGVFAPLASPALTGTPTAPTAATTDNTTKIATTEYVKNNVSAIDVSALRDSSDDNIFGTQSGSNGTQYGINRLLYFKNNAVTNMNTVYKTGFYGTANTDTSMPYTGYWFCVVFCKDETSQIAIQWAMDVNKAYNGQLWIRTIRLNASGTASGNMIGTWVKFASDTEATTSLKGLMSATDKAKLDGVDISKYGDMFKSVYDTDGDGVIDKAKIADSATTATTATSATKADSATTATNANNASTVGGFTVGVNVPADAKFTDTIVDISGKVDKVTGKALSTNDFTSAYKTKLDSALTSHQSLADYAKSTDVATDISSAVSTHNTASNAHSDIRSLITNLTTRMNTLADSDDTTLDQMSEVVSYIKSNKSLIDSVTTSKVNVSDIVDNVTSTDTNKPLSAAQGKALKGLIDGIVIPTVPTKVSAFTNDSGYLTTHQDISGKADKATTAAGYGITDVYTKSEVYNKAEIDVVKSDLDTAKTNITADMNTALTKKVNIDGTTPMTYLDVGDRKAGSVVGKYSVCEGGDKAYTIGTSTCDWSNTASGISSHAAGFETIASGLCSHSEGFSTTASGKYTHAEGNRSIASGDDSHAEGYSSEASENHSHAEGYMTKATNVSCHSEGSETVSSAAYAHAEGNSTTANGQMSHAEGYGSKTTGQYAHAEGYKTEARGESSHAGGNYTVAVSSNQTAIGRYNVLDGSSTNLLIVGNGTADTARSNAFTVGTDGSATVSTKLNCSGIADNDSKRLISVNDIQEMLYKRVRTIAVADWTNKSATISISLPESMLLEQAGMSTFITAAPASCSDYAKFGVYCSAESGTTLTFTCSKVPTVDLNVNILVEYCCPQV